MAVLHEQGQGATTRAIAEAAGIAEGTLFRAFSTKEELVSAALEQALDPTPVVTALGRVEDSLPLEQRLVHAVRLLQDHYQEVIGLMHALGAVHPPHPTVERSPGPWRQPVVEALTALVEPDADRLRVPVAELVEMVDLLTFAGTHPILNQGRLLPPDTIVSVLLDGTRKVT